MAKRTRSKPIEIEVSKFSVLNGTMLLVACASLSLIAVAPPANAFSWSGALSYIKNKLLTDQVNDAIKTATAQDAVGTSQVAETAVYAKQKEASAYNQLVRNENLLDLFNDYLSSGSMTDTSRCFAVNARAKDGQVSSKVQTLVNSDIFNTSNTGYFLSEDAKLNALSDMKMQISCTLEMSAQGYCTPQITDGQYFDVDFGMTLAKDRISENQFVSAKMGVYTIANPVSDRTTIEKCNGDSSCGAILSSEQNRLAVSSMVTNSMLNQLYNRIAVGSSND